MARILLIDDDEALRELMREFLSRHQFEIVEAGNGDDALALLRGDDAFDLITCDLIMPGKEGMETIRELRKMLPEVKIVCISGGGNIVPGTAYQSAVLHLGADRFLAKPFALKDLLGTIQTLLESE